MLENLSRFTQAGPRPVVHGSQPHPLYLAAIEAKDEADAALAALEAARRQLNLATHRHHHAVAAAAIAECKWIVSPGARS